MFFIIKMQTGTADPRSPITCQLQIIKGKTTANLLRNYRITLTQLMGSATATSGGVILYFIQPFALILSDAGNRTTISVWEGECMQ